MSAHFRRLGDLAARDYGTQIVLTGEDGAVAGVLRGIWREDFGNGVPGRTVLVELPDGVEEVVVGPLGVSTRVEITGTNEGALAAVSPAQAARARFELAPSIAVIRLRFVGGSRDGQSEIVPVGALTSRLWFPVPGASYRSEYVCAGGFVPDGPRRGATDMVFCGFVTDEETEPAPREAKAARGAVPALESYRVQFMDGPLLAVVDHFEEASAGRPAGMLRLTSQVGGTSVVASYRYANVAARSAVGVRCSYSYVAGSAPQWRS